MLAVSTWQQTYIMQVMFSLTSRGIKTMIKAVFCRHDETMCLQYFFATVVYKLFL